MKLREKILLPLPKELSGVHSGAGVQGFFLYVLSIPAGAYDLLHAAKIGRDGKLIGTPRNWIIRT